MDEEPFVRLKIAKSVQHGVTEIMLDGELDLATAPQLDTQLALIQDAGPTHLVIDLRQLTFIDSTGLAALVVAHRAAETNRHTIAFRRGVGQVQRLFDLTGAAAQFTFEEDGSATDA